MRIRNASGQWEPYTGLKPEDLTRLSGLMTQCLARQATVLIAVVGNKGVGKSLLGKLFRKEGIGPFKPRDIAVIDDDNMAVDFLFCFRRWHMDPCRGIDELGPFLKYCKKKPVRIYIKSNPESRITKADIVLRLSTDEEQRRLRLIKRYRREKGDRVYVQTRNYAHEIKIARRFEMSAVI